MTETIWRNGHTFLTLPTGHVAVYRDEVRAHPVDVIGHGEPDHPNHTGGLDETAAAWLAENAPQSREEPTTGPTAPIAASAQVNPRRADR